VQVDVLGREVMAQLKAAAGDEAFLQGLVQAKQHATAMRRLRRKQQASEVGCHLLQRLLLPAALTSVGLHLFSSIFLA